MSRSSELIGVVWMLLLPILMLPVPSEAAVGDQYRCDVVRRPWIEYHGGNKGGFGEVSEPRFSIKQKPIEVLGYPVKFSIDWKSNDQALITKILIDSEAPSGQNNYHTYALDIQTSFLGDDLEGFVGSAPYFGWGLVYATFSKNNRLLLVEQIGNTTTADPDGYDVYVWHAECERSGE